MRAALGFLAEAMGPLRDDDRGDACVGQAQLRRGALVQAAVAAKFFDKHVVGAR